MVSMICSNLTDFDEHDRGSDNRHRRSFSRNCDPSDYSVSKINRDDASDQLHNQDGHELYGYDHDQRYGGGLHDRSQIRSWGWCCLDSPHVPWVSVFIRSCSWQSHASEKREASRITLVDEKEVFEQLKKCSRPHDASYRLNARRGRSVPVAVLLVLAVLLSATSGVYAGASFLAQQTPNVTVTTTGLLNDDELDHLDHVVHYDAGCSGRANDDGVHD